MEINRFIHDQIFDYLIAKNEKDPNFLFRLRRSNRFDRLAKGFWFHGNEDYLALSFWSGSDWKNKTPNIYFQFHKNQSVKLFLSAKDSREKSDFFRDNMFTSKSTYEVYHSKIRLAKTEGEDSGSTMAITLDEQWNNENLTAIIDSLIDGFKKYIDGILVKWDEMPHNNVTNYMGPVDRDDFNFLLNKIHKYRDQLKHNKFLDIPLAGTTESISTKITTPISQIEKTFKNYTETLPSSLKSINIEEYKDLKNIIIKNIANKKQWIFITGENGTGKSSLLEAITIGLNGNQDGNLLLCKNNFKIKLTARNNDKLTNSTITNNTKSFNTNINFACYGPNRFDVSSNSSNSSIDQSAKTYNLFNGNGKLLNIEDEIIQWDSKLCLYLEEKYRLSIEIKLREFITDYPSGPRMYEKYDKYLHLYSLVKDILLGEDEGGGKLNKGFLPDIVKFDIDTERQDGKFKYVRGDKKETMFTFSQLSTGNKSLMAMAGDIICRFLSYNSETNADPSEFSGIVIIDEIDAHVHPAWQKQIPSLLSEAFPKIQFIVTCHSPIPLLGFEDLSRVSVFKMYRDENHDSQIQEIEIDLEKLTPNTILTSPIFDFQGTFSSAFKKEKGFTAYADYEDYIFDKILKRKLAEIEKIEKHADN